LSQASTAALLFGDRATDAFLEEAMDANGLDYVGGDDFGLVCSVKRARSAKNSVCR
jgi:uncharacterized protein YggL (DUF469 family)